MAAPAGSPRPPAILENPSLVSMSPIGRIFVVLNLILAATFLGWASTSLATSENWQEVHAQSVQEHESMLAEKDQSVSALEVKANTLTEEQSRLRSQRDQFESQVEELKGALASERRRADELDASIKSIEASIADYAETIKQLSSEKERILERLSAAENARDEAQDQVLATEMEKRDVQDELRRAQARIEDLEGGVAGN